jgi:hypothetical protein
MFSRFARYAGDKLSRRARGASSGHRSQCFLNPLFLFENGRLQNSWNSDSTPQWTHSTMSLGNCWFSSSDTTGPGSPEQSELCENALDRPPALDTHVARGKCWSPLQPGIGYNTLTDLGSGFRHFGLLAGLLPGRLAGKGWWVDSQIGPGPTWKFGRGDASSIRPSGEGCDSAPQRLGGLSICRADSRGRT